MSKFYIECHCPTAIFRVVFKEGGVEVGRITSADTNTNSVFFVGPTEGRDRAALDVQYGKMKDDLAYRFLIERAALDRAYAAAIAAIPLPAAPIVADAVLASTIRETP